MKTFEITGKDGTKHTVEQLGTFAFYVQGGQFRFVVTRAVHVGSDEAATVTHRASGKRVTGITYTTLAAARGDYADAGKLAMTALIEKHGEARVRSVLAAAEG
jgi:hypothetical protein